jgi:hypothetical protein
MPAGAAALKRMRRATLELQRDVNGDLSHAMPGEWLDKCGGRRTGSSRDVSR